MIRVFFLMVGLGFSCLSMGQVAQQGIQVGISIHPALNVSILHLPGGYERALTSGLGLKIDGYRTLSPAFQLKGAIGVQYFTSEFRDYSPLFPGDFDPATGMVDRRKSYYGIDTRHLFMGLDMGLKWALTQATNHFFFLPQFSWKGKLATGGEMVISESGSILMGLDPEHSIFQFNDTQFFTSGTVGYEWQMKAALVGCGIFYERGLSRMFDEMNTATQSKSRLAFLGLSVFVY